LIVAVTNPLPAAGGIDAQTIEEVRQNAPSAIRKQERAVTTDDYAEVSRRCDAGIQRAAATFRWTGSWRTVFLTVDRIGGARVDDLFEDGLRRCLERYRMAGHDVEVDGPRYVSLEVEMVVCVKRNYFSADVKAALLEVFSNRYLPDGRRGVFHPDNFTFGQPVYLSSLYAAAQAVQGIDSVELTKFQRQGIDSTEAIDAGQLSLERLEIARLDNDPNFPERGVFNLIMRGGQ
jgi:predicted phage baseplate assembly protein